jgi:hypothetical protein
MATDPKKIRSHARCPVKISFQKDAHRPENTRNIEELNEIKKVKRQRDGRSK